MFNATEGLLLPGPDFFFTFNTIVYSVPMYTFLSPGPYFADFKNVLFHLMLICSTFCSTFRKVQLLKFLFA